MKKILLFSVFLALGTMFITSCNKCKKCEYSYIADLGNPGFQDDENVSKYDESCANSNDDLDSFVQDWEDDEQSKKDQGDSITSPLVCSNK